MPTSSDWSSALLAGLVGLFFGAAVTQSNLALAVFGAGFAVWLAWGVRAMSWSGRILALVAFVAGLLVFAKI